MARLLGGLAVCALAQAASVTVNLGPTTENLTLAGQGANSSGLGTYIVTLGTCTPGAGSTTCTLSGSYTGTTSGFTAGTYTLVTTYPGTGPSQLMGVEQSAGSNLFQFSSVPNGTTITLNLTSSTGTVVVPLLANNNFLTGASLGMTYTSGATCSGTAVPSCDVADVGVTSGSSITGSAQGSATFTQSSYSYYFSQLAIGGGWQTTITLVNYSPQTTTCTTNFYSDGGTPLTMPFSSGSVSTRTDALAPGQVIHDQTMADLNASSVGGWAESTCTGPVQASLLYRFFQNGTATGEAGVNAETAPTTKFATFAQTNTGVAYANPSTTQTASVTLTVISSAGARLGSKTVNLGPLAHGAANVGPLLGLQSFTGFIEITSTQPIISLSLNAEAFPVFSSLPAGDLPSSTPLVNP